MAPTAGASASCGPAGLCLALTTLETVPQMDVLSPDRSDRRKGETCLPNYVTNMLPM